MECVNESASCRLNAGYRNAVVGPAKDWQVTSRNQLNEYKARGNTGV